MSGEPAGGDGGYGGSWPDRFAMFQPTRSDQGPQYAERPDSGSGDNKPPVPGPSTESTLAVGGGVYGGFGPDAFPPGSPPASSDAQQQNPTAAGSYARLAAMCHSERQTQRFEFRMPDAGQRSALIGDVMRASGAHYLDAEEALDKTNWDTEAAVALLESDQSRQPGPASANQNRNQPFSPDWPCDMGGLAGHSSLGSGILATPDQRSIAPAAEVGGELTSSRADVFGDSQQTPHSDTSMHHEEDEAMLRGMESLLGPDMTYRAAKPSSPHGYGQQRSYQAIAERSPTTSDTATDPAAATMLRFRTAMCTSSDCKPTPRQDCANAHDHRMLRRIPYAVPTGPNSYEFTYSPKRCMTMWAQGSCSEGSACRLAHNNDEIAFHPQTYKTQPCEYLWDAAGPCSQRGPLCPKAHNTQEQRDPRHIPHELIAGRQPSTPMTPLFSVGSFQNHNHSSRNSSLNTSSENSRSDLSTNNMRSSNSFNIGPSNSVMTPMGMLHSKYPLTPASLSHRPLAGASTPSFPTSGGSGHTASTPSLIASGSYSSLGALVTRLEGLEPEGTFDVRTYKTMPCLKQKARVKLGRIRNRCADRVTCDGYHDAKERRRRPDAYAYSSEPCPAVYDRDLAIWGNPAMCERGDDCRLAHSLMEVMYHKEKYKTKPCERWAKPPLQCSWGERCAYKHGENDNGLPYTSPSPLGPPISAPVTPSYGPISDRGLFPFNNLEERMRLPRPPVPDIIEASPLVARVEELTQQLSTATQRKAWMEHMLQCPGCHTPWSRERALPCGHVLCKRCVETASHPRLHSEAAHGSGGAANVSVNCVMCHRAFPLGTVYPISLQ